MSSAPAASLFPETGLPCSRRVSGLFPHRPAPHAPSHAAPVTSSAWWRRASGGRQVVGGDGATSDRRPPNFHRRAPSRSPAPTQDRPWAPIFALFSLGIPKFIHFSELLLPFLIPLETLHCPGPKGPRRFGAHRGFRSPCKFYRTDPPSRSRLCPRGLQ